MSALSIVFGIAIVVLIIMLVKYFLSDKNSLSSVMPTDKERAGGTDSITALKSLHSIMSDKFDQMITVMERSADIQARLLNNSMV